MQKSPDTAGDDAEEQFARIKFRGFGAECLSAQLRFDVLGERRNDSACNIVDKVRAAELCERAGEAVTDSELDLGRALVLRHEMEAYCAAGRRTAEAVAAAALYIARIRIRIAVD